MTKSILEAKFIAPERRVNNQETTLEAIDNLLDNGIMDSCEHVNYDIEAFQAALEVITPDEDMSSLKIHNSGVYMKGNPDKTIKVGFSTDLMSRITSLRASNTSDSNYYAVIPTTEANAYLTEQYVLDLLSPSRRYPVATDLRQDQKEVFKMTDQIMHLIIHFLNTTCFEPFKVYKNIGDNPLAA